MTSVAAMDPTPTRTTLICDRVCSVSDVNSGKGSTRKVEPPSLLGALEILPTELIFRNLDIMHPHQYSGFPCTSTRALVLVNRKLEVAEHCYTTLTSWTSATAPHVNMQRITLPPGECRWEGLAVCYGVDPDFNDPDLWMAMHQLIGSWVNVVTQQGVLVMNLLPWSRNPRKTASP